jgi:two-component system, chemotaxis family, response regulator PixG
MVQSSERVAGLSFKDLILKLKEIKTQSFSGNLIVKVDPDLSWILSFRMGRIGWVSGGVEPINCWQRNLTLAQLDLPADKLAEVNHPNRSTLDSNILAELLVAELIDRQKCAELVARMIVENLFDIIQFSQRSGNQLSYQLMQTGAGNSQLNLVLPLLEIEPILTKTIQAWQEWSNVGLTAYAPSQYAIVSQSLDLSRLSDNPSLHKVVQAIDGDKSLRSLAVRHHQSVIDFTSALLPLLRSGFINLSLLPLSKTERTGRLDTTSSKSLSDRFSDQIGQSPSPTAPASSIESPLIACIDDSILIYQSLERILTEHKFRCYGVQDPLKIMPSLIRNKPDFIFLDLLMPITNGYEVCEQIRKTPSLKHIPVIILTGKDGLIDRMRSKMVGATGFLGKPVQEEAVLKMIEKYLTGVSEES